MLRGVVAIVGLLVGMALMALPAAAHATHTHPPQADHADASEPGEAQRTPVVEAAHDHAVTVHDHESNPVHSHAPGEDTYHQKASHCSLDFAHMPKTVWAPASAMVYVQTSVTEDSVSGITVSPPVPPPLG